MRLLLKGLVGMALVWLVIGFGMELFFLADRVPSGIKSNRWPGDVIPDDNDCGRYVPFSSVTKENIMTLLFTPLHLWRLYDYSK